MYTPSHKVQIAAVLWAQGFNAGYIGQVLAVSDKSVYQRLSRMKQRDLASWQRMTEIRKCHIKSKRLTNKPHKYADLGDNDRDTVTWYEDGVPQELRIIHVF